MPILAEALDLSRPAAAAALDRLVELGVARELTGRARDRVFAWAAPLAAVAAPPAT
jgi:Fic family protein